MKKSIFQKNIFILTSIILFVILFLAYNKNKALALDITEEVAPIICEEGKLINPQCYPVECPVGKTQCPLEACPTDCTQGFGPCCCDVSENELEIPIGRAVDQAEYLADKIIEEMTILIEKAGQLSERAREMPGLANQCDISNCLPKCDSSSSPPSGCTAGYTCSYQGYNHTGQEIINGGFSRQDCKNLPNNLSINPSNTYAIFQYSGPTSGWCNVQTTTQYMPGPCEGDACPFTDIHAKQNEINTLAQAIYESQQKIEGFTAEMEKAFEKLQNSRNKLADCVVRPYEADAAARGEITGKFLLSCEDVLIGGIPMHSFLGDDLDVFQQGCYGNTYCQTRDEDGKALNFPPEPCANDYYCCY